MNSVLLPPIATLLPHAGHMILIDEVLEAEEERLTAAVVIREDSVLGDARGVPAWLGLEYMAQSVAALAGWRAWRAGEPVRVGFLLGTRRYTCHCPVFLPGSCLNIEVEREFIAENGLEAYRCSIRQEETQLAEAIISVFQPADAVAFLELSGSAQAGVSEPR